VTNDTSDAAGQWQPSNDPHHGRRERVSREPQAIPVSCALHRGPRGFANLVVERKRDGEIVLAPHVTGACVIILDEDAATALFEVLRTWLRR
jgi:hypothetical protein